MSMVVCRSVTLLALASAACAHATLDEVRAAYSDGDLRRSQKLLAEVTPTNDADKRQIAELSKSVEADKKRVLSNLLAGASRARERADEGAQGYDEAIGYYEAALALLGPSEPQRKSVVESRDKAKDAQRAREVAFATARKAFTESTKCNGVLRDRLGELWTLRRACDSTASLVPPALKAAEQCAKAERYDDALQLRAVLDDAAPTQQRSLDIWPAEAQGWFALVELRAQERALRTAATTTTPSTATFGPAAQTAAPRRAVPSPRSSPSSRTQSVAPPSAATMIPSGRADVVLARARKLYDGGSVFDALLVLDDGLAEELSDSDRAKLEAQEETWAPDRRKLIDEYLRRGESALREEQIESAYAWYQRILTLDPSHEVAQDRVRRLDRLKSLKQQ